MIFVPEVTLAVPGEGREARRTYISVMLKTIQILVLKL
jgi:hypothetical protein